MDFIFDDVCERDMDLLLMEEFATSPTFLRLFADRAGIGACSVQSIQHSKTHPRFGESDIEVILADEKGRVGILIEDKIDAIAMPEQAARYFERGREGVQAKDYDRFIVFIVAPDKYLAENAEAQKYPNFISYEEILSYFEQSESHASEFKAAQIRTAISKQKKGYQVEEDPAVTEFWHRYAEYQKAEYPPLWLRYNGEVKGTNATWPRFDTVIRGLYFYHKTEFGCVDLTFDGYADRIPELEQTILEVLGGKWGSFFLQRTGKAAALRLVVPVIDVHLPFESQIKPIQKCYTALFQMSEFAKKLASSGFAL